MTPTKKIKIDEIDPLDVFRLPSTENLEGKELSLSFLDGGSMHVGIAGGVARFTVAGRDWPEEGEGPVDAVELRNHVYFVDIDTQDPGLDGMTLVLLYNLGWGMAVHQRRVLPEEQWSRGPEVQQGFAVGSIDGCGQTGPAPALTRDLVGARNFLMMGPKNLYEHLYLNSMKLFAHHVYTNVVRGKAEVQRATYYKLDEQLYMVAFREMDNAAGLITIEDYANHRMTGKAFHPLTMFESCSRPIGGMIIPVSPAPAYPDDLEPL